MTTLPDNCKKTDSHTTSLPKVIAKICRKVTLMGKCLNGTNYRMTKLEHESPKTL